MNGRNLNRNNRNHISFRGRTQSQFNYHDQVPHHSWGFGYARDTYVPHHGWDFRHARDTYVPHHGWDFRHVVPHHGRDFQQAGGTYVPHHTSEPTNGAYVPHHTSEPTIGRTYVPHRTSEPTISAVRPLYQPQPRPYCKICEVQLSSYKNMEEHNSGKKHQRMLKLREEIETPRISNGQIPNSQVDLEVQPETGLKSGEKRCLEKNVSSEATGAKRKNYLRKDKGVTPEVPAEGKLKDNASAQDHNFEHRICGSKTDKYMKTNGGVRRPMESSKLDINSLSDSVGSPIQIPALAPTPAVTSLTMAPSPVVGSSFKFVYQHILASQTQVLEGKDYHEIQNPTVETSDHPHAASYSNINTQPEVVSSDSAARVIIIPSKMRYCKICEVHLPSTCTFKELELHNKGNRHQRMLRYQRELKLREKLESPKSSNGQISNSQKNLVVQSETVQISGKMGHPLKNWSSEASISEHKNYLQKGMGLTSEFAAKEPEMKPKDSSGAQRPGFKRKTRGLKTGKYMESSKLNINSQLKSVESPVQNSRPTLAPLPEPVASHIIAPTLVVGSSFEPHILHASSSQTPLSEGNENYEIENPNVEVTDQPHAPADSNINIKIEDMSSDSTAIAMSSSEGFITSHVFDPSLAVASSFEPQIQHDSQTCVLGSKEHHEIQNSPLGINDQPPTTVRSSSELQIQHVLNIETEPQLPEGTTDSESQNCSDEKNNQLLPSFVVEFNSPSCSRANAQTLDGCSNHDKKMDIITHQSLVVGSSFEPHILHASSSQTPLSEGNENYEMENPNVEVTDQPHAPADSNINIQIEDMSSDSTAIATSSSEGFMTSHVFDPSLEVASSFEPQIQHDSKTCVLGSTEHHEIQNSALETNDQPPTTVRSSSELQIQHVLHIETEPQLSEGTTDSESQNCTDEKNNQLLPSCVVEFNSPSCSRANAQTADGCSNHEQKMDIITHQSGTTQLSQLAVCLKCGDVGFRETLVFCKKCQVYAIHRYCLDGPVIFTGVVNWFCDCEPEVVETSAKNVSLNMANNASQNRIDSKNCIESVKNKQGQQNIAAKTTVLLSDNHSLSCHGLSQCSNNTEKENKFRKECQPVPKEEAKNSEGSMIVTVPQPIADAVWRGSLYHFSPSFHTVIGLIAHISTLACSKVLEETRFFPDVLCPDLLPRSAVWPMSFMNCGPNEESVALYFFPDTESVEFDKLVDHMMSSDLALRAVVENADLLIFPSALLPIQRQRFQEKYYLWGVFRAKKTPHNTNGAVCGEVTSGHKQS